jgi:hypothetical protein
VITKIRRTIIFSGASTVPFKHIRMSIIKSIKINPSQNYSS